MSKTEINLISSNRLGEKYYDVRHKSGLRVFVFPKSFSTCYGVLGTRFGAVDRVFVNSDGKKIKLPAGTAHFLEHKMFENSDGVNSDERFAALGADDNAYTTYSTTRYLFSTTENPSACLSELIRFVTQPYFTRESVKKEQGIIAQEIIMGEDSPWSCGNENMLRGLYKKSALRDTICGSVGSISKISDRLLYEAHNAFYTPDNMALSVCGNIDCDEVLDIVDRELYAVEGKKAAARVTQNEPEGVDREYVEKKMKVSRPLFFVGLKDSIASLSSAERARRRCGMSLLNNMLFSSSGEFYNRLVAQNLISPSFSFGYTITRDDAYVSFSGEADNPERVAELIREKIEKTAKEGLDASDFERCRRVAMAGYIRLFDSSEEIADDIMMNSWFSGTDPFDMQKRLNEMSIDYCTELLCTVLLNDKRTLSVINPIK